MAKLSLILLSVPVACIGLSVPAAAEDEFGERRSVVVPYHDLNLASVEGRDRLNARVKSAVLSVCNSRPHYRPTLQERAQSQICEKATMADANVKLAGLLNGGGTRLADRGQTIFVSAP
ncbi:MULTISPECIES: UrcA family protein [unclassified Sphingopyxis]|jgi:UrcA family protein|uniref:UrcA family protein n=1 Tax=unclassified Sphingopyxis TaxID=2614943 RepID=UPI002856706E|nr:MULTISPECIES: UrcA family protein [unclassified Sphingopyxis]MDR6834987.1 UrcA family protein [Sphingopyxis sp. BE122]MDR7227258.1 UrcA family protein [Sphingopyxis sp. BE259]